MRSTTAVTRLSTIGLPIQLNLRGIEPDARFAERLIDRRALDTCRRGAVLRRDIVKPVRRLRGAGARHVLRDECRIVRECAATRWRATVRA